MSHHRGFTLIELAVVIVLLGILSSYAAIQFSSRSDFSDYALRDQLISAYRFAQQRSMYDHSGGCYSLSITTGGFEPQRDGVYFGSFGQVSFSGDYAGSSVTPATTLFFDGLGNVYTGGCGGTPVANPMLLTVGETALEVFPTGFVRAI